MILTFHLYSLSVSGIKAGKPSLKKLWRKSNRKPKPRKKLEGKCDIVNKFCFIIYSQLALQDYSPIFINTYRRCFSICLEDLSYLKNIEPDLVLLTLGGHIEPPPPPPPHTHTQIHSFCFVVPKRLLVGL